MAGVEEVKEYYSDKLRNLSYTGVFEHIINLLHKTQAIIRKYHRDPSKLPNTDTYKLLTKYLNQAMTLLESDEQDLIDFIKLIASNPLAFPVERSRSAIKLIDEIIAILLKAISDTDTLVFDIDNTWTSHIKPFLNSSAGKEAGPLLCQHIQHEVVENLHELVVLERQAKLNPGSLSGSLAQYYIQESETVREQTGYSKLQRSDFALISAMAGADSKSRFLLIRSLKDKRERLEQLKALLRGVQTNTPPRLLKSQYLDLQPSLSKEDKSLFYAKLFNYCRTQDDYPKIRRHLQQSIKQLEAQIRSQQAELTYRDKQIGAIHQLHKSRVQSTLSVLLNSVSDNCKKFAAFNAIDVKSKLTPRVLHTLQEKHMSYAPNPDKRTSAALQRLIQEQLVATFHGELSKVICNQYQYNLNGAPPYCQRMYTQHLTEKLIEQLALCLSLPNMKTLTVANQLDAVKTSFRREHLSDYQELSQFSIAYAQAVHYQVKQKTTSHYGALKEIDRLLNETIKLSPKNRVSQLHQFMASEKGLALRDTVKVFQFLGDKGKGRFFQKSSRSKREELAANRQRHQTHLEGTTTAIEEPAEAANLSNGL